ncbi:cytochrome bd-I oxidase subunit CydX [Paramesorhizobium deserti]|uniref:cytochrome bd-I oxidase subunit CydX n=1 Tax=Paramesorhizobium deserti TaxID=1494590 RepID=UPI0009E7BDED|nr:cytochrome bd-I oxidase subunit CydX [Paramesorhizobium deserti]
MWYFSWLLGLPLAVAFAVLNAMWYELMDDRARQESGSRPAQTSPRHAAARKASARKR